MQDCWTNIHIEDDIYIVTCDNCNFESEEYDYDGAVRAAWDHKNDYD